jgi:hypothetical protein
LSVTGVAQPANAQWLMDGTVSLGGMSESRHESQWQ